MLYRNRKPSTLRRLQSLAASMLAALQRQFADTQYLQGLRDTELEELGLRRTPERDYRPFV